jgi:murein DD-endopeptidase MepM/ murein hydrolase activator NlpD
MQAWAAASSRPHNTRRRSDMSWEDIMRRVLPPARGVSPHPTSAYGATNRPRGSTNPHRGVDFNYDVGPNGQTGINLTYPTLRSPVAGVVENAGQGNVGRIAIRDKNGFLHEILHTHAQHVSIGDPVAAGQLIGTMGNTGWTPSTPRKVPSMSTISCGTLPAIL